MAKRPSKRKASPKRRARRRGFPWLRLFLVVFVLLALAGSAWAVWLDQTVQSQFEGKRWSVPATVYARPLELYEGRRLNLDQLTEELRALEYSETASSGGSGTWRREGGDFILSTRAFQLWDGAEPARRLRLSISNGRVSQLRDAETGESIAIARLDPARIGNIYPGHREDRLLVRLEDVPQPLIDALLAVEDRDFYGHWGISLTGIARAAWANVRAGRVVQGGSTLTQQLVKNFYLTSDRTFVRKINEAVMALLLERRYSKDDILESYLNEVYLAQDRDRSIHGVGLASQFLFGEPLQSLDLQQHALMVAMIRGPSLYDPRRNPERAQTRRNQVLRVMASEGVISEAVAASASEAPLGVRARAAGPARSYPGFLALVQQDLRRDYRQEDLRTEGLRIFTTMAPGIQAATENAISRQLEGRDDALEAAAVMVDPESGEVLALVGGRNPRYAGFNRAVDARRPIGSLIKPAVYLTALQSPDRYGLGSLLDDSPLVIDDGRGQRWEPMNFDRRFRGSVPLVDSLAFSLNIPTIRLGMDLGLPAVQTTVERLGGPVNRRLYPSSLLGTQELSPLQVAQMYQTIAAGGFRNPLRSVREVTEQDGTPLNRYPLSTDRAFDPLPVHLTTTALVSAMREGTGRGAYRFLPSDFLIAGKTGTTNDHRDSWFAGFGGDLLGVVWLGRDDNTATDLTGASGALPIWADAVSVINPAPLQLRPPEGVETLWIETATGRRAEEGCAGVRPLPYSRGHGPEPSRDCRPAGSDSGADGGVADWFRGLFQ